MLQTVKQLTSLFCNVVKFFQIKHELISASSPVLLINMSFQLLWRYLPSMDVRKELLDVLDTGSVEQRFRVYEVVQISIISKS